MNKNRIKIIIIIIVVECAIFMQLSKNNMQEYAFAFKYAKICKKKINHRIYTYETSSFMIKIIILGEF